MNNTIHINDHKLIYGHELPIKRIATRINRSEATVKTHLHKAHHQFQELLTPYLKNADIPWLASYTISKSLYRINHT